MVLFLIAALLALQVRRHPGSVPALAKGPLRPGNARAQRRTIVHQQFGPGICIAADALPAAARELSCSDRRICWAPFGVADRVFRNDRHRRDAARARIPQKAVRPTTKAETAALFRSVRVWPYVQASSDTLRCSRSRDSIRA